MCIKARVSLLQDASSTDAASGVATPVSEQPNSGLLGFLGQYRRSSGPGMLSKPGSSSYWPTSNTLIPGRWLSRQPSLSSIEPHSPIPKPPFNDGMSTTLATVHRSIPTTFGLRAVIFISVIAFLLGSLLRSILSPADFVLINEHVGRGAPEWQEIKRLMHIHVFSFGLVVGIVRRAPPV